MTRFAHVVVTVLVLSLGACGGLTLEVLNQTGVDLQRYDVVDLQRQPAGAPIPDGGIDEVDVDGFNQVYYQADNPSPDEDTPNGFIVQMALDVEPRALLTIVYHYRVPPGQEGTDPGSQPIKLGEFGLELAPSVEAVMLNVLAGFSVAYDEG